MALTRIFIAGFGGQGVLLIGQMLSYAAMFEDKEVSWMPSYGPEMRGGTANCTVNISNEPIASPLVAECDVLITMNGPSLDKFESMLVPGGHLMLVELTTPPRAPMKQLFWIYSKIVMSFIGRLISHDDSAYTYLPQSMAAFPQAEQLVPLLRECGFSDVQFKRFTFGLSTMYLATK